jgi:hypothetical protein
MNARPIIAGRKSTCPVVRRAHALIEHPDYTRSYVEYAVRSTGALHASIAQDFRSSMCNLSLMLSHSKRLNTAQSESTAKYEDQQRVPWVDVDRSRI